MYYFFLIKSYWGNYKFIGKFSFAGVIKDCGHTGIFYHKIVLEVHFERYALKWKQLAHQVDSLFSLLCCVYFFSHYYIRMTMHSSYYIQSQEARLKNFITKEVKLLYYIHGRPMCLTLTIQNSLNWLLIWTRPLSGILVCKTE